MTINNRESQAVSVCCDIRIIKGFRKVNSGIGCILANTHVSDEGFQGWSMVDMVNTDRHHSNIAFRQADLFLGLVFKAVESGIAGIRAVGKTSVICNQR